MSRHLPAQREPSATFCRMEFRDPVKPGRLLLQVAIGAAALYVVLFIGTFQW